MSVPTDPDVVLIIPNDADVIGIVPNDADVVLVVPNDPEAVLGVPPGDPLAVSIVLDVVWSVSNDHGVI